VKGKQKLPKGWEQLCAEPKQLIQILRKDCSGLLVEVNLWGPASLLEPLRLAHPDNFAGYLYLKACANKSSECGLQPAYAKEPIFQEHQKSSLYRVCEEVRQLDAIPTLGCFGGLLSLHLIWEPLQTTPQVFDVASVTTGMVLLDATLPMGRPIAHVFAAWHEEHSLEQAIKKAAKLSNN